MPLKTETFAPLLWRPIIDRSQSTPYQVVIVAVETYSTELTDTVRLPEMRVHSNVEQSVVVVVRQGVFVELLSFVCANKFLSGRFKEAGAFDEDSWLANKSMGTSLGSPETVVVKVLRFIVIGEA